VQFAPVAQAHTTNTRAYFGLGESARQKNTGQSVRSGVAVMIYVTAVAVGQRQRLYSGGIRIFKCKVCSRGFGLLFDLAHWYHVCIVHQVGCAVQVSYNIYGIIYTCALCGVSASHLDRASTPQVFFSLGVKVKGPGPRTAPHGIMILYSHQ
jgi:hypothetical protein